MLFVDWGSDIIGAISSIKCGYSVKPLGDSTDVFKLPLRERPGVCIFFSGEMLVANDLTILVLL